jgi:hypothetical protein
MAFQNLFSWHQYNLHVPLSDQILGHCEFGDLFFLNNNSTYYTNIFYYTEGIEYFLK